jgi:hypothetical protein
LAPTARADRPHSNPAGLEDTGEQRAEAPDRLHGGDRGTAAVVYSAAVDGRRRRPSIGPSERCRRAGLAAMPRTTAGCGRPLTALGRLFDRLQLVVALWRALRRLLGRLVEATQPRCPASAQTLQRPQHE